MPDQDFREAEQHHLAATLERHPIAPVSLLKRRASNELKQELRQLRLRQSDLLEMGEARAVECLENALHEIENARQFLAGGGR